MPRRTRRLVVRRRWLTRHRHTLPAVAAARVPVRQERVKCLRGFYAGWMLRSETNLEELYHPEDESKGRLGLVAVDDATGRRFDLKIFDSYVLKEDADLEFSGQNEHMWVLVGNVIVVPAVTLDAVRRVLADLDPDRLVPIGS